MLLLDAVPFVCDMAFVFDMVHLVPLAVCNRRVLFLILLQYVPFLILG